MKLPHNILLLIGQPGARKTTILSQLNRAYPDMWYLPHAITQAALIRQLRSRKATEITYVGLDELGYPLSAVELEATAKLFPNVVFVIITTPQGLIESGIEL